MIETKKDKLNKLGFVLAMKIGKKIIYKRDQDWISINNVNNEITIDSNITIDSKLHNAINTIVIKNRWL